VARVSRFTRPATRMLVLVAMVACGDVTAPLANTAYLLHTVNGEPLPAIIDSARAPGVNLDFRIVGRTLEFLGPDSVQYAEASDVVEPLPDGSLKLVQSSCESVKASYNLAGRQLVVRIPPNRVLGTPLRNDTLTTFGRDSLVQIHDGLRLTFSPGRPDVPLCG